MIVATILPSASSRACLAVSGGTSESTPNQTRACTQNINTLSPTIHIATANRYGLKPDVLTNPRDENGSRNRTTEKAMPVAAKTPDIAVAAIIPTGTPANIADPSPTSVASR